MGDAGIVAGPQPLKFDANGRTASRARMIAAGPVAQNPASVWRGFWLEEPGTATMEVKPGPHRLSGFADWAVVAPLPCIAL
jgi:hypothetical protein